MCKKTKEQQKAADDKYILKKLIRLLKNDHPALAAEFKPWLEKELSQIKEEMEGKEIVISWLTCWLEQVFEVPGKVTMLTNEEKPIVRDWLKKIIPQLEKEIEEEIPIRSTMKEILEKLDKK